MTNRERQAVQALLDASAEVVVSGRNLTRTISGLSDEARHLSLSIGALRYRADNMRHLIEKENQS